MTLHGAIDLVTRMISFVILLQAIEVLSIKDSWKVWQSKIDDKIFAATIGIQALIAGLNILVPNVWCTLILIACAVVHIYKWRGFFNGGADAMTFAILLGCAIGGKFGLYFIEVQIVLSYFIAGVVKAKNKGWWTGETMLGVLQRSSYAVPEFVKSRVDIKIAKILAIATVVVELASPLLFVGGKTAFSFVLVALGFHFANFIVLGLNRFFWVWGVGLVASLLV